MCDLRHQRVVGVGVCQQRTDRQQHFRDSQRRAPLILKNVQANGTIAVDVRVIQPSREVNLRGLKWVIRGKVHIQEEDSASERAIGRSHDGRLPMEKVISDGPCAAVCRWVLAQVQKFFIDPFESHLGIKLSALEGNYARRHSGRIRPYLC